MQPAGNPLVVLLGPTAVGKTALSLQLAQTFDGEIVSADSRLVYRGMAIGVAKPTAAEQALIPHHLLDSVTPAETLSLAGYQQSAYTAIDGILARRHVPFLVGGTGQYISAVVEGWGIPEVPPNLGLREELEDFATENGPQALWDRLNTHDPVGAERIHPNNVRRVIRALEVFLESGTPISVLQQKTPPPYHILQVGLTRPREALHARIDARIDQMMADGLLQEVQDLLAAGYDRSYPAMSGLGYRQLISHLEGEISLEEAIALIRQQTRDFARRQEVWFRKYNRDATWFQLEENPEGDQLRVAQNTTAIIIEFVRRWLEGEEYESCQGLS